MKSKKEEMLKLKSLTKEQEKTISSTLTSWQSLIQKYNSEEKRKDAQKDVEYLKLCANMVNFHVLIRMALQQLRTKKNDTFENLFAVYVLLQTFPLPSLPNLEQFFKDVATSNEEAEYNKIKDKEVKDNESLSD